MEENTARTFSGLVTWTCRLRGITKESPGASQNALCNLKALKPFASPSCKPVDIMCNWTLAKKGHRCPAVHCAHSIGAPAAAMLPSSSIGAPAVAMLPSSSIGAPAVAMLPSSSIGAPAVAMLRSSSIGAPAVAMLRSSSIGARAVAMLAAYAAAAAPRSHASILKYASPSWILPSEFIFSKNSFIGPAIESRATSILRLCTLFSEAISNQHVSGRTSRLP